MVKQYLIAVSEISLGDIKQAVRISHCHAPADVGISYKHWSVFVKNMGGKVLPARSFLRAEARLGNLKFHWQCFEEWEYSEILEIKKPLIYLGKSYPYGSYQHFIWAALKKTALDVEEN